MKVERPAGPTGPDAQAPVGEAGVAKDPAVAFKETLAGASEVAGTSPVAAESVEALVGRLRAGELGLDAVLETLVQQAAQAAPLGPKGAEQLREMLRAVLESDPTLRALVRDIEKG
jgi:hypothetical protein